MTGSGEGAETYSAEIRKFAEKFDIDELIMRYDVDFDIPLRHEYGLGILRMVGAFEPHPRRDAARVARRVGAHWCDVIRCDMAYDHWSALRLIEASQSDARWLRDRAGDDRKPIVGYATARWFDGTGKIHYRLGSYARARHDFDTAVSVATSADLWWCLPDLRSNLHRARFEESRQAGSLDHAGVIERLRETKAAAESEAAARNIALDAVSSEADHRVREFLRGYSSVLQNLAVAHKEAAAAFVGQKGGVPRDRHAEVDLRAAVETERARSMEASEQSIHISRALGDHFRIAQSLNHQALMDPSRGREIFTQLKEGPYLRGRLIARQHLARQADGIDAVEQLRGLLDELIHAAGTTGGTGTDMHVAAFTMDMYVEAVRRMPAADRQRFDHDLTEKRERIAESVRRAVAMPAYKRAYAMAVRPSYLERIAIALADMDAVRDNREPAEAAFGLVEESSARELLDMLATADLPQLHLPATPNRSAAAVLPPQIEMAPDSPMTRRYAQVRRSSVRRASDDMADSMAPELARRETEFEEQFLNQPLEASPHDPEIAHRVRMYTVNHPDTCVVRYFAYGAAAVEFIGAFVFRGSELRCVTSIPYGDVRALADSLLADEAPSPQQCEQIWRTLLAPVWPFVGESDLAHLVLIPTDELFAIPLHVAWEKGSHAPLAARVPVSQSVSATAFVARGRSLLKRQPVSATDNLAAVVVADDAAKVGEPGVRGNELLLTGWQRDRMLVVGDCPQELVADGMPLINADMTGLAMIAEVKPEFFVYAGHGNYNPNYRQFGPYLQLPGDNFLTQYDVALRLRLPRNKLAILGACLAGQGAQTSGGDVDGFLRALIATGAGAVGVPLWSVRDLAISDTVRALLRASRRAVDDGGVFDVVDALHAYYRNKVRHLRREHGSDLSQQDIIELLPLSLYL